MMSYIYHSGLQVVVGRTEVSNVSCPSKQELKHAKHFYRMYGKCSECQLDWHTTDIPQPDDNFDHNEKDEQSKKAMKTTKKKKPR